MDILKELPYDIQNIIYNDYLEKQRDYHINFKYLLTQNRYLDYQQVIYEFKKNSHHTQDLLLETYILSTLNDDELMDKIQEKFLEYYFINSYYLKNR
mgnify:CR=1 FL=1